MFIYYFYKLLFNSQQLLPNQWSPQSQERVKYPGCESSESNSEQAQFHQFLTNKKLPKRFKWKTWHNLCYLNVKLLQNKSFIRIVYRFSNSIEHKYQKYSSKQIPRNNLDASDYCCHYRLKICITSLKWLTVAMPFLETSKKLERNWREILARN